MVEVVAALIWEQNRFLICQRPEHKARGLLWEFVGGKVEPGETKQEALVRECQEELGVLISANDIFMELDHVYPDISIHLTLFQASIASGVPQKLEHNALRWITPNEIDDYAFCPADKDILKTIKLRHALFSNQDPDYKAFYSKLIPVLPSDKIIGVRVPELRKIKKRISKDWAYLTDNLPHKYYEEDMLHGFLISDIKEPSKAIDLLDNFLPFVDNWAVCDGISPACFKTCPEELMFAIMRWIRSEHAYTVRFGIGMLLKYYLDTNFSESHLALVAGVRHRDYYVKTMIAWYFATALAKQYMRALPYLLDHKLDIWEHNKTIQKAIESNRLSKQQKEYLQTIKRK